MYGIIDMNKEIITKSAAGTRRVAAQLARQVLARGPLPHSAAVIALTGELGGGKTTFVQGFLKALGVKEKILSPTFVILKIFMIHNLPRLLASLKLWRSGPARQGFKNAIHVDAYRLRDEKEILSLGWEEIVKKNQNIVIVEWAERIKKILPKNYIHISFEFVDEKTRKIKKDLRYS